MGALGVPFLFGTGVGARDWTADLWVWFVRSGGAFGDHSRQPVETIA